MKKAFFTHVMCLCAFVAYGQTHHLSFWPDIPFHNKEFMIMPATFYGLKTKYVSGEVRWNFETEESVSAYLGHTFTIVGKKSEVSLTPTLGGVFNPAGYKAISPQLTIEITSDHWSLFSFSQPFFSETDTRFYQWTEIAFPLSRFIDIELGVGWQIFIAEQSSTTVGIFGRYTLPTKNGGIFLQVWPQYDPLRDRGSCLIGIGFFLD